MIATSRNIIGFAASTAVLLFLAGSTVSATGTDGCDHFEIDCPTGWEKVLLAPDASYMTCFSMTDEPANCYYDKLTAECHNDPKGTEPDSTVAGGCPAQAIVHCSDCLHGHELVDEACEACDPIHYSTGGLDTCKPCPDGSHVNWDQSGCVQPSGISHRRRAIQQNKRLPSWA